MRSLVFFLIFQIVLADAIAADVPITGTYKKEAWCFDQRGYGADQSDKWRPCKKKEYDTLTIRRKSGDLYEVDFSFTQFATTAGTCDLSGLFRLENNTLLVSESDKELKEEGCAMQIQITPKEFKFSDPANSCSARHCGRNQNINGEVFPRNASR
ncbi:hypothetical protein [Polaromonas sp. YR568]|uniref:hypothetical protein n=1 Tax=Polaromonas sp. YR568 TaxID=1855301 RepID=UPI00398BD4CE